MNIKKLALTFTILSMVGCQNQVEVVTPAIQAQMLDDLKAGKLSLTCGFACDFTWIQKRQQIHALDIAERWQDLAVRVMQIGYGGDLAYYYLGQAAQGLGDHPAAIQYYQYSLALSQGDPGPLQCEVLEDGCAGVDLQSVIPVLIKASQDAIAAANAPAAPPPPPPKEKKKKPAAAPLLLPPPPSSPAY
jgi:hypothetical protein